MNEQSNPNNPPAFPQPMMSHDEWLDGKKAGMTLWHWFAGQALIGQCSRDVAATYAVDRSCEVADLMMLEHARRFGAQ